MQNRLFINTGMLLTGPLSSLGIAQSTSHLVRRKNVLSNVIKSDRFVEDGVSNLKYALSQLAK